MTHRCSVPALSTTIPLLHSMCQAVVTPHCLPKGLFIHPPETLTKSALQAPSGPKSISQTLLALLLFSALVRKEGGKCSGNCKEVQTPRQLWKAGLPSSFPISCAVSLSGEASVSVRNTCRKIMTTKLCTGICSRCTSWHQPSSMQPAMEMLQEILMRFSETQHGLRGKSGVREGGSMKGAVRAAD